MRNLIGDSGAIEDYVYMSSISTILVRIWVSNLGIFGSASMSVVMSCHVIVGVGYGVGVTIQSLCIFTFHVLFMYYLLMYYYFYVLLHFIFPFFFFMYFHWIP